VNLGPHSLPKPPTAEQIAYWYLRLNGFLQIENFYVHPTGRGGARTDADLLAVRFPHRAERLVDDPNDIMADDADALALTRDQIDVVIAEVKEGRCQLNGPWTDPARQNVQRVLAAIGCVQQARIGDAAAALYAHGYFEDRALLRVRLVALGSTRDEGISAQYPRVCQITLEGALRFIFRRLERYWRQKRDTQHWNGIGRLMKQQAARHHGREDDFVAWALGAPPPAPASVG
jgi:hypothetical protein